MDYFITKQTKNGGCLSRWGAASYRKSSQGHRPTRQRPLPRRLRPFRSPSSREQKADPLI